MTHIRPSHRLPNRHGARKLKEDMLPTVSAYLQQVGKKGGSPSHGKDRPRRGRTIRHGGKPGAVFAGHPEVKEYFRSLGRSRGDKEQHEVVCAQCGKRFTARNARAATCSDACRKAQSRTRQAAAADANAMASLR